MEKEYKMSQARKDELEQELNYLKTTRSDEVAEQIKIARGFGDLSENSEYDEAKNEQGKLYSRIAAPSRVRAPTARRPATRSWALRSPIPCTASSLRNPPSARPSWAPRRDRTWWWKLPSATSTTPL